MRLVFEIDGEWLRVRLRLPRIRFIHDRQQASTIGSRPFWKQLPKKISPKEGAMTQRMPMPASAQTAISRELPVPKNSPQTRICAPR